MTGKPADRSGAVLRIFCKLGLALLLSACTGETERRETVSTSYFRALPYQNQAFNSNTTSAEYTARALSRLGRGATREDLVSGDRSNPAYKAALQQSGAPQCSVGDRFDSRNTLAFDMGGGKRLGLNMDVDMENMVRPSLNKMKVEFRMKFGGPDKDKKSACRYDSQLQGLAGSAFNEIFRRRDNTIWGELEDYGVNLR